MEYVFQIVFHDADTTFAFSDNPPEMLARLLATYGEEIKRINMVPRYMAKIVFGYSDILRQTAKDAVAITKVL